jgi:hypothetical protein
VTRRTVVSSIIEYSKETGWSSEPGEFADRALQTEPIELTAEDSRPASSPIAGVRTKK